MKVLVTGGAGYIGSHTCVSLLEAGFEVTVLDNLSNGSVASLERVQALTSRSLRFVEGDCRNQRDLHEAMHRGVHAVIHFAALKAVGDSCQQPLRYFDNNIGGTISLLNAMEEHRVTRLVFSSSATVYGEPAKVPVGELASLSVTNPYGRTKLVMEQLIHDWVGADDRLSAVLLRYFNPVGAHPSGCIGEDPLGEPNNLMPYVAQVAVGRRARLQIFGDDYATHDGTGVRDYIHVMDLAEAHVRALHYASEHRGCEPFNIGTGLGYSVLDIIQAFEIASGRTIDREVVDRRPGDVAMLTADPSKANRMLGWRASRDLKAMCEDAWRWQQMNPQGYR